MRIILEFYHKMSFYFHILSFIVWKLQSRRSIGTLLKRLDYRIDHYNYLGLA